MGMWGVLIMRHEINEIDVHRVNKDYNFKIQVFGNKMYLCSKFDNWFIENKSNHTRLRHIMRTRRKTKHHLQRKFHKEDWNYIFNSIKEHDDHVLNRRRTIKIDRLFEMVEQDRRNKYIDAKLSEKCVNN